MSSAEMTTRQDTRDLIITSVSSLASTTTELEDMQSVLSIGVEATSRTEELTYNSSVQSLDILDMLTTEATTSAFDTSYEDFAPAMQILDYSMTVQENSRREYIASQNASRFAYTTQLIQIFAPSLFDSARRFNGEHVLGSFRLRYNSTTSPSIGAFASATDMKHALETLYLSNGERIEVDVMQSYSAVALEGTIMAVPGSSNLRCVSFTCGFATLPAGEYVRVGDSPDADWYTVYHTHDASDSKFLSLGLESDYRTRASYTGASSTTNTTLYRWGRGNGWKITFVGNTSVTNPTSIQMLENDGDDNELSPASATVSIVAMSILALANDTGIVKTDRLMSSIRSIASLATADMVDGQEAFESVTNSFRLTRSMISSSDGTSNASALTIPKTQQEKSLDAMDASSGSTTATTPEVYIPMGETGSDGIAEEVTISVMKISSSLLELDGDVKSDIISIDMSALPTSFDSSSSTELNITIPNTQALDFSYEAMPSILTHCFFDDYSVHEYACPSNSAQTSLTVHCNGTEGVLENRCSSLRPTPSCDAVDGSSVSSAHCRVIAFDESSTTCACQMASDVRRRNRRLRARRLQTDDDASSSDEEVSVNYATMLTSVQEDFVETFVSTESLSVDDFVASAQVFGALTSLFALVVFAFWLAGRADAHEAHVVHISPDEQDRLKKLAPSKAHMGHNGTLMGNKKVDRNVFNLMGLLSSSMKGGRSEDRRDEGHMRDIDQLMHQQSVNGVTAAAVGENEMNFVEQALPSILRSEPFWKRLRNEMQQYHRWFCIVFHYSETFSRRLRVLTMATNITVTAFIQTLTYNLSNPDDGTCETYTTEVDCLAEPSDFDASATKCSWAQGNRAGTCSFNEPEDNILIVLFIALLSAIVSIPFLVTTEWVIKNWLTAKTKRNGTTVVSNAPSPTHLSQREGEHGHKGKGGKKDKSHHHHHRGSGRRGHIGSEGGGWNGSASLSRSSRRRGSIMQMLGLNAAMTNSSAVLQTTLQQDMAHFIHSLRNYRRRLSPHQRIDFDAMWGLKTSASLHGDDDDSEESDNEGRGGDVEFESIEGARSWLSHMSGYTDTQSRIVADLKTVRNTTEKESVRMQRESYRNDRKKGLRLMLLFQKDLLPGVNGQILNNKDNRDNFMRREVSVWTKVFSWIGLITINLFCMVYVYLFALAQSQSRQNAWMQSFFIWLLCEIFIVSTAICYFTHFVLPSIIARDLQKVKQKLVDTIRDYQDGLRAKETRGEGNNEDEEAEKDDKESTRFNAAKYFFVSYRIAQQHPSLREAKIINKFSSPWPKASYQRKAKDVESSYNAIGMIVGRFVGNIAINLAALLLNAPAYIQDMLTEAFVVGLFGYIIYMHLQLFEIFAPLVVLPTVTVAIMVHFYIKARDHDKKVSLAKTTPITDAHSQFRRARNRYHEGDYHYKGEERKDDEEEEILTASVRSARSSGKYGQAMLGSRVDRLTAIGEDDDESHDGNSSDGFSDISGMTMGSHQSQRKKGDARRSSVRLGKQLLNEMRQLNERDLNAMSGKQRDVRNSGSGRRHSAGRMSLESVDSIKSLYSAYSTRLRIDEAGESSSGSSSTTMSLDSAHLHLTDSDSLASTLDSSESSVSNYSKKASTMEGGGEYSIGSKLAALKQQRMSKVKKPVVTRHQSAVDWVNIQSGEDVEQDEESMDSKEKVAPSPIARVNRTSPLRTAALSTSVEIDMNEKSESNKSSSSSGSSYEEEHKFSMTKVRINQKSALRSLAERFPNKQTSVASPQGPNTPLNPMVGAKPPPSLKSHGSASSGGKSSNKSKKHVSVDIGGDYDSLGKSNHGYKTSLATFDPDANPETTVPHMIEGDMKMPASMSKSSHSSYTGDSGTLSRDSSVKAEMSKEATENAQQSLLDRLSSIDMRLQQISDTRNKLNQQDI
jgi:hypothetical protein